MFKKLKRRHSFIMIKHINSHYCYVFPTNCHDRNTHRHMQENERNFSNYGYFPQVLITIMQNISCQLSLFSHIVITVMEKIHKNYRKLIFQQFFIPQYKKIHYSWTNFCNKQLLYFQPIFSNVIIYYANFHYFNAEFLEQLSIFYTKFH